MLTNPRVAGWRTHNGEIVGRASWPPALSEEKWRQLVALFSDPARHSGGTAGRVHLLTGLARCGVCDRPMGISNSSSKAKGQRRRYWCEPCQLYREVSQVDAYVTAAVVRMLEDYRDSPTTVDPEVLKSVENLRARIQATRIEFAEDDTVTPQELREMLRHLRGRLKAEEAKLAPSRRSHILDGVAGPDAAAAWDSLTLDRRRAVIGALVEVRLHRALAGRRAFDPDTVEIASTV
jgi:site-specific DNA recombinase